MSGFKSRRCIVGLSEGLLRPASLLQLCCCLVSGATRRDELFQVAACGEIGQGGDWRAFCRAIRRIHLTKIRHGRL